jgi:hypothetical protein
MQPLPVSPTSCNPPGHVWSPAPVPVRLRRTTDSCRCSGHHGSQGPQAAPRTASRDWRGWRTPVPLASVFWTPVGQPPSDRSGCDLNGSDYSNRSTGGGLLAPRGATSNGSPAWAHAPKSSKRFLPSGKPGSLRMVAYPPNPLLREVRPAGATALVGLKSAMVRGLRYVES